MAKDKVKTFRYDSEPTNADGQLILDWINRQDDFSESIRTLILKDCGRDIAEQTKLDELERRIADLEKRGVQGPQYQPLPQEESPSRITGNTENARDGNVKTEGEPKRPNVGKFFAE